MKHIFSRKTDKMKTANRFSSRTCIRRPEPTARTSALRDITSKLKWMLNSLKAEEMGLLPPLISA